MHDQLTMQDLPTITTSQYLDRLITLVTICQSMEPDRYLRELDRLQRIRPERMSRL